MYEFTIDFSGCQYFTEMHDRIRQGLQLPDFYGENLDALWDSVTGIMATPTIIHVKGRQAANPELQAEIAEVIDVLKEAQASYREITFVLEA